MSLARFYLSPERWTEGDACLQGEEARHCAQVLRHGVGDTVIVFDGKGRTAKATIRKAEAKRIDLQLGEHEESAPPSVWVTLVQAIPKGSNMDLIIEKAVELGINEILPIFTARTIVRIDTAESSKKQQKWQRIALEACKQCGQDWLPAVHAPTPFQDMLKLSDPRTLRLIAALLPEARSLKSILATHQPSQSEIKKVSLSIGPEGDFTAAEYALALEQGFLPLNLGKNILRVETAAMFGLSIIQHELRPIDEFVCKSSGDDLPELGH